MSLVLLVVDAGLNLGLGVLLATFPAGLVRRLGVPQTAVPFYPRILGAVLFGIGVALLLEAFGLGGGIGLGLGGAVAINLCGAAMLGGWLLSGLLDIPRRGAVFLWVLVAVLVGLSAVELVAVSLR